MTAVRTTSGPTRAERALFGPQEVGGRYHNGYWNKTYTVLGIRTVDGYSSITVQWNDDQITTHCTRWDPQRDTVLDPTGPTWTREILAERLARRALPKAQGGHA